MHSRPLVALVAFLLAGCSLFRPKPPEYDAVELASGLTARELVVPDIGEEVVLGDTVAIHYDLRLVDGTVVESSRGTGQPLRFEVGAGMVPKGLEQGLVGMRLFGRRRLHVASELAFGSEGRPPQIPPDADVVFEVELMEHVPAVR